MLEDTSAAAATLAGVLPGEVFWRLLVPQTAIASASSSIRGSAGSQSRAWSPRT